jgi:hypothetical protein
MAYSGLTLVFLLLHHYHDDAPVCRLVSLGRARARAWRQVGRDPWADMGASPRLLLRRRVVEPTGTLEPRPRCRWLWRAGA